LYQYIGIKVKVMNQGRYKWFLTLAAVLLVASWLVAGNAPAPTALM